MWINFWQETDSGLCTSNEGRFLKFYKTNILDNFKSVLFCFHTFGVRRPGFGFGSRALGFTEDVWHQMYANKKEGIWNNLKYPFKRILKISLRSRYRAPDPFFFLPKPDPHAWFDLPSGTLISTKDGWLEKNWWISRRIWKANFRCSFPCFL